MRLSGFATGMDINQMVQDLMRAERMPMDRMKQDQQQIEWKMDQYREINLKLDQFRTSIFDTVYRRSLMTKNIATSTNEQLVTATASATAGDASFRLSSVTSLASAATNASSARISGEGEKIDTAAALGGQTDSEGSFWQTGVVNRQVITVDQKHTDLNLNRELGNPDSVVVRVNGVSYQVVEEFGEGDIRATQVMITTDDDGNEILRFVEELAAGTEVEVYEIDETDENAVKRAEASITVYDANGEPVKHNFSFTSDQSLNDIMKQINDSGAGVSLFYDSFADKVAFSRTETGSFNDGGNEMSFEGEFFTDFLKMDDTNERGGTNAEFTVNGLTTYRHSNTFTMDGVTMTLQGTFDETDPAVTIGAKTDVDSIFDTIKGFVDDYNELVELVNGKITEEFFRDYRPLTDDQKDAMSDREIEKWEERAMSGLLRNDRTLRSGFNTFRMDMYTPVTHGIEGAFNHISQIGLTTTSNYRDGGKLELDEAKLRAAIEQDPEAVFQIFAGDGSSYNDKGIARRVRESANGLIDQVSRTAGGLRGRNLNHQFTLGREMDRIDDRISNFERRMQQVEQRYWSQFNAMEKAVAQANAQAESLFAQLYGGMG